MEKLAYSVPEMAEVLGIGRNVAYELVHAGNFYPAIKIGDRRIIISAESLRRWLEEQSGR